jgi:hypothetical protein
MSYYNTEKEPLQSNGFAVFRNGFRVSEEVYPTKTCSGLLSEYEFWNGVVKKWSKGDKVEILQVTGS